VLVTVVDGLERHGWNVDFEWRGPVGPLRRLTAAEADQFDEQGYVVLEDVVPADRLAAVTDALDGYEAKVERWLRRQEGERFTIAESGAITFATHAVLRSPEARAFAVEPAFVDTCADLVGPDVNLYWDQAVYKKPEKPRRFPWHQDNGYTFVESQQYLTCWVALTDATEDNGCPWVAPGLHRLGTLRHRWVDPLGWECFAEPPAGCVPVAAPVPAGGMVVFSSLTPHLTGPNRTDAVRKAYILQYAPAGAAVQTGDVDAGPPTGSEPCDDPDRQFAVLRDGRPVPLADHP
jgi:ectoine hydroxylase-related dioxygenase (phytanoyl-CoA dioxygenase family)